MANWIDVFAVVAIAFFVFYGIQRGVMKSLLDIFAVLVAIFFAGQMYRYLSYTIMPFLKAQDASVYAIMFSIFWIISFVVLELVVANIIKLMKVTFIGTVENLGGALLGLIQGILVIGVLIQLCLMLPLSTDVRGVFAGSMSKRMSVPTLVKSYSSIFGMFPKIDFFIQQKVQPVIPSKDNIPPIPARPTTPPRL
jgi:membrane protein required for colicin V production